MANGPYGFQPDKELGGFEKTIIVIFVCLFFGAWGVGLLSELIAKFF